MTAQEMVAFLIAQGETPTTIANALEGRVSSRTVYRWKDGKVAPQQASDLAALGKLVEAKKGQVVS